MAKLCFVAMAVPRNIDGDYKRRNDHRHPKPAPATHPARIFENPENDVSVLVFPDSLKRVQFL